MKRITDFFRRSWRSFFVLVVFTVPASKGIFGKFFSVNAAGANNLGNNLGNNDDNSGKYASPGAPQSNPAVSPIKPQDTCSTGRLHAQSHGDHHGIIIVIITVLTAFR